ncbi:MAG TPA: winged helix DNA-binding domain-containing protein [Candidatus Limnocylindria bacterium]|nr:winged helix DNA-binding domain-containing protein [Candidatus Limnocylindria bacterium]
MQRFSVEERRRRLAVRHRVAPALRAELVEDAARAVVCLHGTDSSSVYLSAWARTNAFTVEALDRALYERRTLVRLLAMRRTVFVVPAEDAAVVQSGAAAGVARVERRRTEALVAQLGVGDVEGWLGEAEAAAMAELERRGEVSAQELARAVPMLAARVRLNPGRRIEGNVSVASRVLLTLAVEGRVVRGRPRGTWLSSQYRWTPMARWLGAPLAELDVADAQAALARRWLARFGPATQTDLRWWTGWTAREARAALAAVKAVTIQMDGAGPALILPDDGETTPEPDPWVALLPTLDPTTMGWKERAWYLGSHARALFDTAGNAGPTIWSDGRVVGGWAVLPSGRVVTRLLEDIGGAATQAVALEAARLTEWLASTAVAPRFATPLARELVAAG